MSKRIWHHPAVPADETTVAWRSPGQLQDTAEFRQWLDREFPQGLSEMADSDDAETTRRSFLKLMGASTALAGFGLAACRRPEAYIVPYTRAPEWVIPGKATYYATNMPRAHGATPLVVTTFEGRPTKLAPNNLHPEADGTDAFAQASILDLYSPSRSRAVLQGGQRVPRANVEALLAHLATHPDSNIGFVFGTDVSPTRTRLISQLAQKFSAARFYHYEPLAGNGPAALGDGVRQVVDFNRADRIVSLDCDFVSTDPQGPVTPFFNRRKPEGGVYENAAAAAVLNRLYAVESAFSLTGGMADHRLRVAPSQVTAVAAQLARALGAQLPGLDSIAQLTDEVQIRWVNALAEDLRASGSRTAVLAGSRQPAALHHLALAINLALGNMGGEGALRGVNTGVQGLGSLATLKADIDAGAIETLIFLTPANPVYDAPADLDFAATLAKVPVSVHLGLRLDATAHACTWHIPAAHYLESWSDTNSIGGVYGVVQPMILPLYPDCVSELELLQALLSEDGRLVTGEGDEGAPSPAYQAVRTTFAGLAGEGDGPWRNFLRDGFLADSFFVPAAPVLAATAGQDLAAANVAAPTTTALEVVFATDASVYDGRWIDNGWLQEAPDPISKLTWDNAALIAPKTARDLGVYDEIVATEHPYAHSSPDGEAGNRRSPLIKVNVNGRELEIAALISFGQAENTIVIPLGYGQGYDGEDVLRRDTSRASHVGQVGVNSGFDAYPLRTSATPYFATGATASLTRKRAYPVALVQEHHAMYGRALAREISTIESDDHKGPFEKQLANVKLQGNDSHAPPNISLYKPEDRKGQPLLNDPLHQWGMSIDLSSCMGCNACLVSCQAENNIPIVGKAQVAKGREMHWIRMDRYFATQEYATDSHGNRIKDATTGEYRKNPDWVRDNPSFVPQPVACVHCEMAPCEVVCPVNATVHTEDGLNAMAYNRCIGTRYCENNCPYKARRFNFFDYNKRNPLIAHNLYKGPLGEKQVGEAPHLQRNPNVTVRMRGVIEKCTYCVQRLKDSVIRQKRGQKQEVLAAGVTSPELRVTSDTLRIPVDSVKTACQEACPANAITFGNLLDGARSAVGRTKVIERNYDLLNYIGTRPRTSYLARVKNPNEAMPDAPFVGKSTIHMV
jgi:MoCo/4Fe-4S cofactor protein with predicted Tat translocation signal